MFIWQAMTLRILLLGCFGFASMAAEVETRQLPLYLSSNNEGRASERPKAQLMRKPAFDDKSGAPSKRLLRKDTLQTSIELDENQIVNKLKGANENRHDAVVMTTYNPTYDDPAYDPGTDPDYNPSSAGSSDDSSPTRDGNTGSRTGVMDGQSGDSDSDNA